MIDTQSIKLEFLPNPARENEGINHAGIQTYRADPYSGAARESGQNSRDAAEEFPVTMSFDRLEIARDDIPCIDELEQTIGWCQAQRKNSDKERSFFAQAQKVVSSPIISVLRISDSNTTGARGPSVEGMPFHSLVKAAGVSTKESTSSGGSFGIGKNAVFAVSDLQTVFYCSKYRDGSFTRYLAQGKTILASHTDGKGDPLRQVGYWGGAGFEAIDNASVVPAWLRKEDVGTAAFALGVRETPNWQYRMMLALVENFFPAVHRTEMKFRLDNGQFEIGPSTLPTFLSDPKMREVARANNREQSLDLTRVCYECLVSTDATEHEIAIMSLGKVRIRVLVKEGLPRKVFILRNGMVITDTLEHFGEPFGRFPMYREFVALVEPIEESGSAFVKRLEDPKHRELSAEYLSNEGDRALARTVMKALGKKVREVIKSKAKAAFSGEAQINELAKYFGRDSGANETANPSKQDDPAKITYRIERKKKREIVAVEPGEGTKGGGGGEDNGLGKKKPGVNSGKKADTSGAGAGGDHTLRAIQLFDVRNTMPDRGNPSQRSIFFTAAESGNATIAVRATGIQDSEDIPIISAGSASVAAGNVKRTLKANERTRIDVVLGAPYSGPLEIVVRLDAQEGASV